jgi:hypothetical protein
VIGCCHLPLPVTHGLRGAEAAALVPVLRSSAPASEDNDREVGDADGLRSGLLVILIMAESQRDWAGMETAVNLT